MVDELAARPEVDPARIGAVGLSGGGHVALNAAYLEPDRISALWLDGIQAQRLEDFPSPENVGERFATLINALILKMVEFHLGRAAPPPFVQILAELVRPPLVIVAGGRDDFEQQVSQKYAEVVGPNGQVWLIDEAGHVGGRVARPEEYRRRMVDFFDTALAK